MFERLEKDDWMSSRPSHRGRKETETKLRRRPSDYSKKYVECVLQACLVVEDGEVKPGHHLSGIHYEDVSKLMR